MIKYIIFSLNKFAICVETYQVRRINKSTFLVTNVPDINYNKYGNDMHPEKAENTLLLTKNDYIFKEHNRPTTVSIGEKKNKVRIPSSYIKRARAMYFKHFYETTTKTNNSTLLPQKNENINTEFRNRVKSGETSFKRNQDTVKRLVALLISENINIRHKEENIDVKTQKKRGVRKFGRRVPRYKHRHC